eukprot:TRINITY_DN13304_c0_g1_i1.p1 TRINITY_DN13304_c0_g1~~TRINITY_DN13304_c0_g1_i1.p1  ORF type:complete len:809 (-),score=164.09 TRINITY_DN13304_c0_g1_i1:54-2480(-)
MSAASRIVLELHAHPLVPTKAASRETRCSYKGCNWSYFSHLYRFRCEVCNWEICEKCSEIEKRETHQHFLRKGVYDYSCFSCHSQIQQDLGLKCVEGCSLVLCMFCSKNSKYNEGEGRRDLHPHPLEHSPYFVRSCSNNLPTCTPQLLHCPTCSWFICRTCAGYAPFQDHQHSIYRTQDTTKGCDECGEAFGDGYKCDSLNCDFVICCDCLEKHSGANYWFHKHYLVVSRRGKPRCACKGYNGPFGYIHAPLVNPDEALYCFRCDWGICSKCTSTGIPPPMDLLDVSILPIDLWFKILLEIISSSFKLTYFGMMSRNCLMILKAFICTHLSTDIKMDEKDVKWIKIMDFELGSGSEAKIAFLSGLDVLTEFKRFSLPIGNYYEVYVIELIMKKRWNTFKYLLKYYDHCYAYLQEITFKAFCAFPSTDKAYLDIFNIYLSNILETKPFWLFSVNFPIELKESSLLMSVIDNGNLSFRTASFFDRLDKGFLLNAKLSLSILQYAVTTLNAQLIHTLFKKLDPKDTLFRHSIQFPYPLKVKDPYLYNLFLHKQLITWSSFVENSFHDIVETFPTKPHQILDLALKTKSEDEIHYFLDLSKKLYPIKIYLSDVTIPILSNLSLLTFQKIVNSSVGKRKRMRRMIYVPFELFEKEFVIWREERKREMLNEVMKSKSNEKDMLAFELVQAGCTMSAPPHAELHYAIKHSKIEVLKYLLKERDCDFINWKAGRINIFELLFSGLQEKKVVIFYHILDWMKQKDKETTLSYFTLYLLFHRDKSYQPLLATTSKFFRFLKLKQTFSPTKQEQREEKF